MICRTNMKEELDLGPLIQCSPDTCTNQSSRRHGREKIFHIYRSLRRHRWLCRWLYRVIDKNFNDDAFNQPPNREPYTYDDLKNIGVDSVMVTKANDGSGAFTISFAEIGSYDDFVEGLKG